MKINESFSNNEISISFCGIHVLAIIEMEPMQKAKSQGNEIIWQVRIIATGRIVLKFSNISGTIFRDPGLDTLDSDIIIKQ